MTDRYPPTYTPPYKLLPYFFGATFGLLFALAGALGCAVAAYNGRQPLWLAIPAAFVVGFVAFSIVGIVLVEDARRMRRGHGRKPRPDYFRQTGPAQARIPHEVPIDLWKAEKWMRQVANNYTNLSQRGAKRAARLEREDANAMINYLAERGLWRFVNGRDNRQGGEWTDQGDDFIEMVGDGVELLDALAHVMFTDDDNPPHPDSDDA